MSCFYRATLEAFLRASDSEIMSALTLAYANAGFTRQFVDQTLTWQRDVAALKSALADCASSSAEARAWGMLLEFSIPRKEGRIDAVILAGDKIVVLEAKTSAPTSEARRQIEEYALLLHYFHKGSRDRLIFPLVVSPEAAIVELASLAQLEIFPELPTYWVKPVTQASWSELARTLLFIAKGSTQQICTPEWDDSPYEPIPSILEAAVALKSGLSIREIAHSEASEQEIADVHRTVQAVINQARTDSQHAICFLTGVPGSGKTLVGLSLAHSEENKVDSIHFMSGNGPLVQVLQHLFTQHEMKKGIRATQARINARALLENVHVFASYHTTNNLGPPANHAVIFDEAQRAWNRNQNYRKFARDYSEPAMLLRIMERLPDWAVVVALVGGGQEINDGEAGLEEWGKAILSAAKDWKVFASPEVLCGGASTAGHRLFLGEGEEVQTSDALHLRTSHRSLRADTLATWVNHVIDGESDAAASLNITERYPIFVSRDLGRTRAELHRQAIGENRCGLVGSSGAARLRAEGLEPSSSFHAGYPWEHWYLADAADVRSSFRCEVFATEFEIQGLELDWVGLCWGGDFVWDGSGWLLRNLRHGSPSRWLAMKNPEKRNYRRNAYRVLLTRSRKGMILFIPKGFNADPTQSPDCFDRTAEFLVACGAKLLP